MRSVKIKVCGVTSVNDAQLCADAGVDTLGVNFWPGSPRRCELDEARNIVRVVPDEVTVVALFVDAPEAHIRSVLAATGIQWVQLHGSESPSFVRRFLPFAYKALPVSGPDIQETARRFPGEHLLLDASVPGQVGGTGRTFDWSLAKSIARERKLTLAGGLNPQNVAEAIAAVQPHRVDVASGVEGEPGSKDPRLVEAFVQAVRDASMS